MASLFKRGNTYAVVYRLKGHQRQYVFGIKTKTVAREIKLAKEREEQLSRADLPNLDPGAVRIAQAARRSLREHIMEFQQYIIACGDGTQHAHQQAAHVRRLLQMARIETIADLRIETIQLALHKLHGPRCGPRTCNAARQAVIQWEAWLQTTGRVRQVVLQKLTRFNEREDVRRKRRALSQLEIDWLLSTTAGGKDAVKPCGIPPLARARMYAVGICTGFRRRALLSLTRASFFVDELEGQPFVRLAARFNKNRRHRDQPLPRELAVELRGWFADQIGDGPLWRPLPHADLSLRFRRDIESARAAWLGNAETPDERRKRETSTTLKYVFHDGTQNVWADFHSLRHTAITFAVRGVGLRAAQVWADHSTPMLTANYAAVEPSELVRASQSMPEIDAIKQGDQKIKRAQRRS